MANSTPADAYAFDPLIDDSASRQNESKEKVVCDPFNMG